MQASMQAGCQWLGTYGKYVSLSAQPNGSLVSREHVLIYKTLTLLASLRESRDDHLSLSLSVCVCVYATEKQRDDTIQLSPFH
mmetsp:Transcript_34344/g.67884  ORF Transcript_34344/g.67884 Transcript_34344/m.67884 type:complete len:83 (+) Transcript_34344:232-480(+)